MRRVPTNDEPGEARKTILSGMWRIYSDMSAPSRAFEAVQPRGRKESVAREDRPLFAWTRPLGYEHSTVTLSKGNRLAGTRKGK